MPKNILVISSSPRKNGNSDALAYSFARGAENAGNNVEKITLYDKHISFCKGCMACQKTRNCVINDDAGEIVDKMLEADVIVFATPIYYYSISGQLKTMLDRSNPLYTADYRFRDVYLLASAAEDEENTVNGAVTAVQGWINCFQKASLKGVVFAGGVTDIGEIAGHPALEKAYDMGKNV
ncbi:MAG: flavodoxin family protein [Oscillospiraceae bacterium]|nr:flavodoxin family protein [Oscillospiraceae bacterium]